MPEGEFLAIVGFSGSGKTTLINLIAGLLAARRGHDPAGRAAPSSGPGPDRGVVFQSYALLPWLTVMENVQLAVDSRCSVDVSSCGSRETRARQYVEMVGLERGPLEVSAGALGRDASTGQRRARTRDGSEDPAPRRAACRPSMRSPAATLQTEIEQIWAADRKTVRPDHERRRRGDPARGPDHSAPPGTAGVPRSGVRRAPSSAPAIARP